MSVQVRPLVVIGVGNVLLGDDAIGVRVVDELRSMQSRGAAALPDETLLLDGGTLLLDLLHLVRDARGLVLVDALRRGEPEGTVSVLHGDAIAPAGVAPDRTASVPGELLALGRLLGWLPEPVALVGVEVADTQFGTDLTPVVAASLPKAVETVRDVVRAMDEQITASRHRAAAPSETTGAAA